MVDIRITIISGFHQHRARWNGSLQLKENLIDKFTYPVEYFPWRSDWKAVAENMWLLKHHNDSPVYHVIAGYSYGGGWGVRLLTKYLKKRGVEVEHVILCDPVHRGPLLPLGWIGKHPVFIPDNVKHITLFRQEVDYPRGCQVRLETPIKQTLIGAMLDVGHIYADDEPRYHDAVINAILNTQQKERA